MEVSIFSRYKKLIIIYVSIVFTLIIGGWLYNSLSNPNGEDVKINGIEEHTKGKPSNRDVFRYIEHDLLTVINLNSDKKKTGWLIDDVGIREKSYHQTLDNKIHTVTFIADIPSLRQSYRVNYQWAEGNDMSVRLDEYGTNVTCLPVKDLIFGDFQCKDSRMMEIGLDKYDQVARFLPYKDGFKYTVRDFEKDTDKEITVLKVDTFISQSDTSPEKTLKTYEDSINKWLESNKLNPSNYIIEFIN